jgi:hypothetical protein
LAQKAQTLETPRIIEVPKSAYAEHLERREKSKTPKLPMNIMVDPLPQFSNIMVDPPVTKNIIPNHYREERILNTTFQTKKLLNGMMTKSISRFPIKTVNIDIFNNIMP